ncbi:MAG: LytTR family transcriptional regulator [Bacteroidaceae bacterium]|nr:LytTR family transcriptional regulator [Bacteroidaceae bacterium]
MKSHLVISTANEIVRIMPDSIICITSDGNYSNIVQTDSTIRMVTCQLGQIETMIHDQKIETDSSRFIRIGKSLIVNSRYIYYINIQKQKLLLSDARTFTHDFSASKEALKQLKDYLEKEEKQ